MIGCPFCSTPMVPTMETSGADYCGRCEVFWFADGPAVCVGSPAADLVAELAAWAAVASEYGPIVPVAPSH